MEGTELEQYEQGGLSVERLKADGPQLLFPGSDWDDEAPGWRWPTQLRPGLYDPMHSQLDRHRVPISPSL